MRKTLLFMLLAGLCPSDVIKADSTNDEVRRASPFKDFSVTSVAKDAILEKRINFAEAPNIEVVQTCFILAAPTQKVMAMLLSWNPAGKELEVSKHETLTAPVTAESFNPTMRSLLGNSAGGAWLVKQSLRANDSSCELLLGPEEKAQLAAAKNTDGLAAAWSAILLNHFTKGQNGSETAFKNLIGAVEKLAAFNVPSPPPEAHYYWELSDVDSRCTISEAASWKNASPLRVFDGEFFVTSEYAASFNASTLWPVKIDGKDATVVWRIDSALSDQFNDLKGAERMASTGLIATSIKKTIAAFRQELSK